MKKSLSKHQIKAFYHNEFFEDQTRDFISLVGAESNGRKVVIDIGGGCGYFAKRLAHLAGYKVRVIDMDAMSVEQCWRTDVEAMCGDALNPHVAGDEDIVSFNMILHHLVGTSEQVTIDMQRSALAVWLPHVRTVFVNEYIYESYIGNLSGWLIFQITKSRILSCIGRAVSNVMPSLKANTFGVGVRFRAHQEWVRLFASAGYDVKSCVIGNKEYISLPRRLLLIKCIRRDSFLLRKSSMVDKRLFRG